MRIVKENRKKLFGCLRRNFGNTALLGINDDLMPEFLWNFYEDKAHARELKIIYLAVEELLVRFYFSQRGWYDFVTDREEVRITCSVIHAKYWKRFIRIFSRNVKIKYGGYWPEMNKTQALKEFLAMGFIYKTDIDYDPNDHYCVYAHIGGLWWPEAFESHQDAIAIQMNYGIPGLTGTTLKKT